MNTGLSGIIINMEGTRARKDLIKVVPDQMGHQGAI